MYTLDKDLLTPNEKAVWELIEGRYGKGNAITSTQIEEITGLNRFRTCKAIQSLRLEHRIPVASSKSGNSKGYFLPVKKEELKDTIDELLRQAETLINVADTLDRAPLN